MSKHPVLVNLLKSLVAVVIGNAIYFLGVMPLLPPLGQHGIARLDLGLLIDLWVCLVVFGVIQLVARVKRSRASGG